jgi:hypothetical protein
MSIATNLAKLGLGVNAAGVIAPEKGGTGTTTGGGTTSSSPTVTSITYTGDDTATNITGGDTVTINGTNFNTGVNVLIGDVQVNTVTRVSSTQITFVAPANAAGSYIIYVVNTDGSVAISIPGIQYSGVPAWSTAAGSLGNAGSSVSFSTTLAATGDAPISYALVSGTLPAGVILNSSTGVISGTTPSVTSSTTYNFTVRATDAQNQDTNRAFSLTVTAPAAPTSVDYLVVGGGGGGGFGAGGGGGGGGGLRTAAGYAINPGVLYTVTVGLGGLASAESPYPAATGTPNPGNPSAFGPITAAGGGGGAPNYTPGGQGGSGATGGGGSTYASSGGAGTSPYINYAGYGGNGSLGYAGGNGRYGLTPSDPTAGGGGGGMGSAGNSIDVQGNGNGGAGLSSSYSGTATTYSGGGGGGSYYHRTNPTNPAIGRDGGADGSKTGTPANAEANRGGGGGGGGGPAFAGSNGGSGVVIIRYLDTYAPASATTGSPTVTVSGGYRIYKWTTSGSITF